MVARVCWQSGYVGVVERLPALNLSVAWLSNTTEFNDSLFVGITAINNLFIKNAAPEIQEKIVMAPIMPVIKIKKYAGWYRNVKTNKGVNITLQHDSLLLENTPLLTINETNFRYMQSAIKFTPSGGFILTTTDKVQIPFTKETPTVATPGYLKAFTGTYYSKETKSSFKLIFKVGKLMLEQNYLKDVVLSPTYKGAFNFYLNVDSDMQPVPVNILFEKCNKKTGLQCQVSMNDARKIRFVKIE